MLGGELSHALERICVMKEVLTGCENVEMIRLRHIVIVIQL